MYDLEIAQNLNYDIVQNLFQVSFPTHFIYVNMFVNF